MPKSKNRRKNGNKKKHHKSTKKHEIRLPSSWWDPGIKLDSVDPALLNVDLGGGHSLKPYPCGDGTLYGLLWCHPPGRWFEEDGKPACGREDVHCEALINFDKRGHKLRGLDPLKITPSLVCELCGAHGMVTHGYYEPMHDMGRVYPDTDWGWWT